MDKRLEANIRVKKNIIDALFCLMKRKNLSEISITDIVEKAGVARQSYYRNFHSKESIIEEFFTSIHQEIIATITVEQIHFLDYDFVFNSLKILLKHKDYILTQYHSGFVKYNIEAINRYIEEAAGDMPANSVDRYLLYYFAGAMYNTSIKWLENGAVESCEDMAHAICKFKASDITAVNMQIVID